MSQATVLLVDDEPDILQLLEITLGRMNLSTLSARSLGEARQLLEETTPDLCLTDMRLPDGNGLTLIEYMQSRYPEVPVAMITAHGSVESAIEALKLGAFDFVTKPLALEKLRELVGHALRKPGVANDEAEASLIGKAPAMVALREQVRKVARSQAPVHIHGESGVGKEVVARLIHRLGPRQGKPFIAVNCGAIPPELVESELFGHKKGSFTGAAQDKQGLFLAAHGGTLLLDEVADLPLPIQVKLLRVIQEKSVRAVGAEKETPIDVRLLSATHKTLAQEVSDGRFRDDLYYRINVIGLHVPALRDRLQDIPQLVSELLKRLADEQGSPPAVLTDAAATRLANHDYPGNVRELENILARASALADSNTINEADLMFTAAPARATPAPEVSPAVGEPAATPPAAGFANDDLLSAVGGDLESYLADTEREILNQALMAHRWNRTTAAKALGISFRSLRYRLKKLGLED
ncbi:MAG: sigma-54 dependent transcriptional regulator [Cellvibrionales bacterium]|jgi:two-component system response regulator PilR (NtrC family)